MLHHSVRIICQIRCSALPYSHLPSTFYIVHYRIYFIDNRLDDLVEVDNEQDTVNSIAELKRKLEDISRRASGVDNPNFVDSEDGFDEDSDDTRTK